MFTGYEIQWLLFNAGKILGAAFIYPPDNEYIHSEDGRLIVNENRNGYREI
jgi:hypothetical protein